MSSERFSRAVLAASALVLDSGICPITRRPSGMMNRSERSSEVSPRIATSCHWTPKFLPISSMIRANGTGAPFSPCWESSATHFLNSPICSLGMKASAIDSGAQSSIFLFGARQR